MHDILQKSCKVLALEVETLAARSTLLLLWLLPLATRQAPLKKSKRVVESSMCEDQDGLLSTTFSYFLKRWLDAENDLEHAMSNIIKLA